jgi:hypothetical protein
MNSQQHKQAVNGVRHRIEYVAHMALDRSLHFRGRASRFKFDSSEDTLVVRGSVPSYYLKQVLQETLKTLDGVGRVENCVEVVSADGLSSVRDR